jgi:hypothetical protein
MTLKHIDFGEELIGSMAVGAVALLFAVKRGADSGNPAWAGFAEKTTFADIRKRFGLNSHTVGGVPVPLTPLAAAVRIDEIVDQWQAGRGKPAPPEAPAETSGEAADGEDVAEE